MQSSSPDNNHLPPSLQKKPPELAAVLRQFHGASGDVSPEDREWLSKQGGGTRSLVDGICTFVPYVASEDHDPNPGLGLHGGTNEDFEDK
ncbi:MAG: hypothetical protein AAB855_05355 [Patescibacteria group bacterium]